ncbi:helix-turn-helix domain-containing protein [Roseibium salinum]|nr:helix-turn-helix domain-containing protein [Roseibium salinum]
MKSYGQFCPIAKAAEIFCERWTALVLRNLGAGACRFNDIHRGVPHMSATLLARRLRQLEDEGLVERRRSASGKSWTYYLTDAGAEFLPLVGALAVWGQRWTRRDLEEGEIDLGLLIWGLEYSVDPAAFGTGRTVLRLAVTDQPENKRFYWFVCERKNAGTVRVGSGRSAGSLSRRQPAGSHPHLSRRPCARCRHGDRPPDRRRPAAPCPAPGRLVQLRHDGTDRSGHGRAGKAHRRRARSRAGKDLIVRRRRCQGRGVTRGCRQYGQSAPGCCGR